ncbi:MAG: hypothetical protein N4A31_02965 [Rickettsiales bacterium]|jgi:hypothetical protein|nr:hypothetical protein [Rickettsiales bacterium]
MPYTEIIQEAHSWLGTRFKHQGRVKISSEGKGGCDCLGLIIGLGLKTKFGENLKNYDQQVYPKLLTSDALLEQLDLLLESTDEVSLGNILLIRINNWPQHLAVVVETNPEIIIIHSYLQTRKVVKQRLPDLWKENIARIYQTKSHNNFNN